MILMHDKKGKYSLKRDKENKKRKKGGEKIENKTGSKILKIYFYPLDLSVRRLSKQNGFHCLTRRRLVVRWTTSHQARIPRPQWSTP